MNADGIALMFRHCNGVEQRKALKNTDTTIGSRFVNSRISQYGVGAKEAAVYLAKETHVLTHPNSQFDNEICEFRFCRVCYLLIAVHSLQCRRTWTRQTRAAKTRSWAACAANPAPFRTRSSNLPITRLPLCFGYTRTSKISSRQRVAFLGLAPARPLRHKKLISLGSSCQVRCAAWFVCSNFVVCFTGMRSEQHPVMRHHFDDVVREIASVYHFYLHGPFGRGGSSQVQTHTPHIHFDTHEQTRNTDQN